jgi:hypothetical protein
MSIQLTFFSDYYAALSQLVHQLGVSLRWTRLPSRSLNSAPMKATLFSQRLRGSPLLNLRQDDRHCAKLLGWAVIYVMVTKHYGHLSDSYGNDMLKASLPSFAVEQG